MTINNPTEEDLKPLLPAGWRLEGQPEKGEQGTEHFQGMLRTPQVRFSAVKKVLPRAHIELARNAAALQLYVKKDETRAGEYQVIESAIPTIWEYQKTVAQKWDPTVFQGLIDARENQSKSIDQIVLKYVDSIVAQHVRAGMRGVEFIAINPMWRTTWKHFWASIIERDGVSSQTSFGCASSPQQAACPASDSEGCSGSADGASVSGDVSTDST